MSSSPPIIRRLSPDLVDLMAAGEVIDSLGAAVRELVENALDAGALRITVELWPQQWRVRVTDDGSGIRSRDLVDAALPHTTSKLGEGSPPLQISTLGFRGEALHSLAQVGRLQIRSFAPEDPHGWLAEYDSAGQLIQITPAAGAQGTVVRVSDLFAQWPARRSVVPDPAYSVRQVIEGIQKASLTHPQITWQVRLEDRPHLSLWPCDSALERLPQLLPRIVPQDLQQGGTEGLQVILGLPDRCHRPRPDWMRVAVNGRFVQIPELIKGIQSAFHQTLPRHRYPVCLAFLDLSPDQVDWNRHPAKQEVYLQDLEGIQTRLQEQIRSLLGDRLGVPSRRAAQLIKASESKQSYVPGSSGSGLTPLKALAQLQNTYILAEHGTGLWLVEQHVAHERVRYEQIQAHWEFEELADPLLISGLTPKQRERLESIGIELESFGVEVWRVRRIPRALILPDSTTEELIEAVEELSRCGDLEAAKVATACRTAIRNGTPLTVTQMQRLLDAWQITANPHTCPHGRPIYLSLVEKDLARFFRRNWTVCDNSAKRSLGTEPLGDLVAEEILGREDRE